MPPSLLTDPEYVQTSKDYQKHLPQQFNPFEKLKDKLVGTLYLKHDTFESEVKIVIDIPKPWGRQNTLEYPIQFQRDQNSQAGVSTAASLEQYLSAEEDTVRFHLYSKVLIPVFEEMGQPEANAAMKSLLSRFADIIVSVEPQKLTNTTIVYARTRFDVKETPQPIGEFEYSIISK